MVMKSSRTSVAGGPSGTTTRGAFVVPVLTRTYTTPTLISSTTLVK
jgi:hypothetical protein